MIKKIVQLIFCFTFLSLSAQETWTLEACIHHALENNLTVRNTSISHEIANISYTQSKWGYMPEIYAGSNVSMNFGRSIDPTNNGVISTSFLNNTYNIGASVDLFKGFYNFNQMAYRKYLVLSAKDEFHIQEDEIAFAVMNAYYDVVYFEELIHIAQEQQQLSAINLRKTEVMVITGLKVDADLLEMKANYEKDALLLIQAQNRYKSALLNLRRVINLESSVLLSVDKPHDSLLHQNLTIANAEELFGDFQKWSPKLSALENYYKASVKKINIYKSGYSPSLNLQTSIGSSYFETNKDMEGRTYNFNYQIKNNLWQYVGITLSIPIFRKNEVRTSIKTAKLELQINQNILNNAKQDIQLEIIEGVNNMIASSKEISQMQNQMEADKLVLEAAQKKYDKGMISVIDYYTAMNRISNTKAQLLRAQLTMQISKRIIDFYNGKRFWK